MNKIKSAIIFVGIFFSGLLIAKDEIHIALSNSAYETVSSGRTEMAILKEAIQSLYPNDEFVFRYEFNAAGMRTDSWYPDDVTLFDKFIEYISNTENKLELQEILGTNESSAKKLFMRMYLKLKEFSGENLSASDALEKLNVFLTLLEYMGKTIAAAGESGAISIGDTARAVEEYSKILDDGNCLIVVAQGSGAFITNNARQLVASKIRSDEYFQIVGVGPSTSKIEGGGSYITLEQDIWGGEGWFNDALDFTDSNEPISIGTNNIPIPALPFFDNYIENYLKEGTEGRRVLLSLIQSAIENARSVCGFRITEDKIFVSAPLFDFGPSIDMDVSIPWDGYAKFPFKMFGEVVECNVPFVPFLGGGCRRGLIEVNSSFISPLTSKPLFIERFDVCGPPRVRGTRGWSYTTRYYLVDARGVKTNSTDITFQCFIGGTL